MIRILFHPQKGYSGVNGLGDVGVWQKNGPWIGVKKRFTVFPDGLDDGVDFLRGCMFERKA